MDDLWRLAVYLGVLLDKYDLKLFNGMLTGGDASPETDLADYAAVLREGPRLRADLDATRARYDAAVIAAHTAKEGKVQS